SCTFLRKPFGAETLLRAVGESLVESDRPPRRLAGAAITLDDALRVVNAPRKTARRLRRVAGRRKPPAVVNRSQCEIEGGRIMGERQGHERAHRRALKGRSSHA